MRKAIFLVLFLSISLQGQVSEKYVFRYLNSSGEEMWKVSEYFSFNTQTGHYTVHKKGLFDLERSKIDFLYSDAKRKTYYLLTKIEL